MKKKILKILSLLLVSFTLASSFAQSFSALEWDGDSEGGFAGDTEAGPNGYAIRYTDDRNLLGYRFSVVDKNGSNKVTKVIDVFRKASNAPYGEKEYDRAYKFSMKYNKKQLINNQNSGFSTVKNNVNCYKESDMSFATELPVTSELQTWQNNVNNINKILSVLGVGSVSNFNNGDKILVEPIYDIRLEGTYHALTVTEIALYGKHILGASSDGGSSSTSESWGFISGYVNRIYPNSLFTPDGQGLWDGVSAASRRLKFVNIINKGYGVGIAYTETKDEFSPNLSVKECRAYKGVLPVKSYHYGTSIGSLFANWTYVTGYPKYGDSIFFSVNFPKESENCYVKQTVWIDGIQVGSRSGYSDELEWYDVRTEDIVVSDSKSYYSVAARADFIETNGTVIKYGAVKIFYVPVKPVIIREKVSAYNVEGEVQAYSGSCGSSGKLYFGQRVAFQYKYGAETVWESADDLTAAASRWNGSSWDRIYTGSSSGEDVYQESAILSSSSSYVKNSSIGSYMIPLPSGDDDNSYRLSFLMTSAWSADPAHTYESDTYFVPVVKSDVELAEIRLVNEIGEYVGPSGLTVNETLTVRYVYKNNTDCKVYVKGYGDGETPIPGIFAIPANSTIEVEGADFTVPDKRTFTVWGGVYLDTVPFGNTEYETDGSNNQMQLNCSTELPLTLTAVEPNSAYRESTDVISSFIIRNRTDKDYIPEDGLAVRLRIYTTDPEEPYLTMAKATVVPKRDSNLIYFRWTVPVGLNSGDIRLDADICSEGEYFGLISNERSTVPYVYYTVPDTRYEEKAPGGFHIPATTSAQAGTALWSVYEYIYGKFEKNSYAIAIDGGAVNVIEPATGATAEKTHGVWTMKSGYGISVTSRSIMAGVSGYLLPYDLCSFTLPQYAFALLPEYGYAFTDLKSVTLAKTTADGYGCFVFPDYGSYVKCTSRRFGIPTAAIPLQLFKVTAGLRPV